MGLIRFVMREDVTPQETDSADQWISFLLLPYAALALAVVVVLFCLLVQRCFHQWARHRPDEKPSRLSQLAHKKNRIFTDRQFKDKQKFNQRNHD